MSTATMVRPAARSSATRVPVARVKAKLRNHPAHERLLLALYAAEKAAQVSLKAFDPDREAEWTLEEMAGIAYMVTHCRTLLECSLRRFPGMRWA